MRVADIMRDVIDGMRPGKGLLLPLLVACERAGIEEIDEISIGNVRLIFEMKITPEQAIEAQKRGEKWCSYHERFEPLDGFSPCAALETRSRDCLEGQRERYRLEGRR